MCQSYARQKRQIGEEINRLKNQIEAHVVVRNVYVTMVTDTCKLSHNQYTLIVPQNA